jgi:hypothetical protein
LDQWTIRPRPFPLTLFDVIYAQGQFLAVGVDLDGGIPRLIASQNGSNWTRYVTGSQMIMRSIAYGNGTFVVVGTVDSDCCRVPGVVVSTNGVDWKFWPNVVINSFSAVTYGNGQFIAAGKDGKIARSTNGTNWVTSDSATPFDLSGIAFGNGLFVATASATDTRGGAVERSADGINWITQGPFNAARVIFGRNLFLAAKGYTPINDARNAILLSMNGINWIPAAADTNDIPYGLTYGAGIFVGAGPRGLIETSMDGTNWIRRNSGTMATFKGVAFGQGAFVAVGDIILQSEDIRPRLRFEACCPETPHTYHLLVGGVSNSVAHIQSSSDLINWQPGVSVRLSDTETEALQSNAGASRQFYRAVLSP